MNEAQPDAVPADLTTVDLTNCDREPIHIPGRVQSHGVLLVVQETGLTIQFCSENCSVLLGSDIASIIGRSLAAILGENFAADFKHRIAEESIEANLSYVGTIVVKSVNAPFHAIFHRYRQRLFLELEPAASAEYLSFHNFYSLVRIAIGRLKGSSSVRELCQITAEEVRRISGFDRVMVYRFDADWNGLVLAEDKAVDVASYMDLRFPASDIPRQARELYLLNHLRLISDVNSTPSTLLPKTASDESIDLSFAALRSVSPIHIEYLRNMGVGASMSISVVKEGRLWGLIACHHFTGRKLPYEVRATLEHLGEIVALQLSAKEYAEGAEYRIALKGIQSKLLAQMAAYENFVIGLARSTGPLLSLAGATGCGIRMDQVLHLVGETPPLKEVQQLMDWLELRGENDAFHTDHLPAMYPPATTFSAAASGILAILIPQFGKSHIVWFRREMIQDVKWAGNPAKPVEVQNGANTLHPRKSFETWKETVRGKSSPWKPEEVSAALELREAIVAIILRKSQELAAVNAELRRSNRELESFSYSVSHDLRAPFRHIAGFSDLLQKRASDRLDETSRRYIITIRESAKFAGVLVDSLLAFSQLSRTAIKMQSIDMSLLVQEVLEEFRTEQGDRQIDWQIASLPTVSGDPVMLKVALNNLISNAIKYTRPRQIAAIEIASRVEGNEHVFWIRDNGVGFDMNYKDKLFGVFQRLHRAEDFEGTGIGLANVRRTIEKHGGRTWAEGQPDVGATVYFSIPFPEKTQ